MEVNLIEKIDNINLVKYKNATYNLYKNQSTAILNDFLYNLEIYKLPSFIIYENQKYTVFVHDNSSYRLKSNLLEEIQIENDNYYYISIDGVLYRRREGYNSLIIYPNAKKNEEYIVPKNVSLYSLKDNLFHQKQYYLKRVLYKNKWITFDVNKLYNKINYRIYPNLLKY